MRTNIKESLLSSNPINFLYNNHLSKARITIQKNAISDNFMPVLKSKSTITYTHSKNMT